MATTETKFIEIEGGRLGYTVAGDGPVMLCVPGMGDTGREYERFVPAMLEAGYRVITTDLRGNGLSQGKFKSYTIADLAGDIAAILDQENVQKAYIVACSISGASAGLFAIQQPQRVEGLLLFSPVFWGVPNLATRSLAFALSLPGVGVPLWSSYFKGLYHRNPLDADYLAGVKANLRQPGALQSLAKLIVTPHLNDQTAGIKVPTRIFFGDTDPDFKDIKAEVAKVQEAIPQAQITVSEGVGHYPQREVADEVLPQVKAWLASVGQTKIG